ncbi:MAG: FHA domain-containing protein [Lachnospiraceae bacterium]|nr:FHA domain-containing protein [Lachnospiraceae bacterium]
MEVTYRRNLYRSYMCIKGQEEIAEEYELKMLKAEHVPCLLEMEMTEADGEKSYLYDISGKQQIGDYLSGKKMGYEMLWEFLSSVRKLCSVLPDYLLRETGVCLEEEYIYVNLRDGSLSFTYLPFWNENLQDAFGHCMEQILRRIDHQDQAATELAYQVYQMSMMKNISIRKILGSITVKTEQKTEDSERGGNGQEPILPDSLGQTTKEETPVKESRQNKILQKVRKKAEQLPWLCSMFQYVHFREGKQKPEKEKFFVGKKNPEKEKFFEEKKNPLSKKLFGEKQILLGGKSLEERQKSLSGKSLEERQKPLSGKSLEERQTPEISYPTEILGPCRQELMGKLIYQGFRGCGDILVEGEEFLLGKNGNQAAGVIDAEGISRVHARISKQEGAYYLEDLNSTNGTYLNGEPIAYHQKRKLSKNDRILFGAEEYLFT